MESPWICIYGRDDYAEMFWNYHGHKTEMWRNYKNGKIDVAIDTIHGENDLVEQRTYWPNGCEEF